MFCKYTEYIIVDSLQCKTLHESTYVMILFTVTVNFNCVILLYIIIAYMYCVYGLLIFEIIFMLRQYVRKFASYIKTLSNSVESVHISEFVPVCSANILR